MKERELTFIGHFPGRHWVLGTPPQGVSFILRTHTRAPAEKSKLSDGDGSDHLDLGDGETKVPI